MQLTKRLALALGGGLVVSSLVGASKGPVASLEKRAADVTPTAPGPGDVFKSGSDCTMQWVPGTDSKWSKMTIDLMTGANQNMKKLTNVASSIDGTDSSVTSYKWTCPEVDPYSAIYFYQFTDSDGANPAWTTRFGIASPSGKLEDPPEAKQPTGEAIPWGNGKLVSTSSSSDSSSSDSSTNASSSSSEQESSSASSSASTSMRTATSSATSDASTLSSSQTTQNAGSSSNSRDSTSGASSAVFQAASWLFYSSALFGCVTALV
ncbi:hypothetical protein FA10DRAFT_267081 [Acaromyces ingoldii]|uniref:Yeast cell wall synthesis Kre9/Knh1-like N-terminal domain-containing protein n=1 Tax=Acaromyces ingoldii TaxID=215250 RepID=A0A316YNB0_9BASI|nr:hypothetical protein FA10DRAFT_267081 [Acaromyces ingoldii]PWN90632.1 hypothetical protein FA10DRAFT_267081 [Acaromyces ingoldii]